MTVMPPEWQHGRQEDDQNCYKNMVHDQRTSELIVGFLFGLQFTLSFEIFSCLLSSFRRHHAVLAEITPSLEEELQNLALVLSAFVETGRANMNKHRIDATLPWLAADRAF
jgi:hypothetical protein